MHGFAMKSCAPLVLMIAWTGSAYGATLTVSFDNSKHNVQVTHLTVTDKVCSEPDGTPRLKDAQLASDGGHVSVPGFCYASEDDQQTTLSYDAAFSTGEGPWHFDCTGVKDGAKIEVYTGDVTGDGRCTVQ